uniref:Uncharacterized protein n=1 Tax=Ditylenchus dipsaci TaxID=166011 RepID=A0A915D417_9BILA
MNNEASISGHTEADPAIVNVGLCEWEIPAQLQPPQWLTSLARQHWLLTYISNEKSENLKPSFVSEPAQQYRLSLYNDCSPLFSDTENCYLCEPNRFMPEWRKIPTMFKLLEKKICWI